MVLVPLLECLLKTTLEASKEGKVKWLAEASCVRLEQPQQNLPLLTKLGHGQADVWACPVNKEDNRPLNSLTIQVNIQDLQDFNEHVRGNKSLTSIIQFKN